MWNFKKLISLAHLNRISLSSSGFYKTPKVFVNKETLKGRPFLYFSYGAAVSEVIIDTLTGENKLLQVDILHDVGKSINPSFGWKVTHLGKKRNLLFWSKTSQILFYFFYGLWNSLSYPCSQQALHIGSLQDKHPNLDFLQCFFFSLVGLEWRFRTLKKSIFWPMSNFVMFQLRVQANFFPAPTLASMAMKFKKSVSSVWKRVLQQFWEKFLSFPEIYFGHMGVFFNPPKHGSEHFFWTFLKIGVTMQFQWSIMYSKVI